MHPDGEVRATVAQPRASRFTEDLLLTTTAYVSISGVTTSVAQGGRSHVIMAGDGAPGPCITMRLAEAEARRRLTAHDHGILCTVHAERGVDAVPVVYAAVEDDVGVPIDRVKPKSGGRLQRERNLARDPRATLLIEHWDRDEWSRLWWVRAALRLESIDSAPRTSLLAARLADRFAQYRDQPFDRLLVLRVVQVIGWAAAG